MTEDTTMTGHAGHSLHAGGCLCGAIRYTTDGAPLRVTYCHCRFCQRSTGSAYLIEPVFERQKLVLTRGTPATYEHVSEGSGKRLTINFCGTCGTKLFLEGERFPGFCNVFAGTFDDPNWFARTPENSRHIFVDYAQHGTVLPAGVKLFAQHAIRLDGTPLEPVVHDQPRTIGPRD